MPRPNRTRERKLDKSNERQVTSQGGRSPGMADGPDETISRERTRIANGKTISRGDYVDELADHTMKRWHAGR